MKIQFMSDLHVEFDPNEGEIFFKNLDKMAFIAVNRKVRQPITMGRHASYVYS